MLRLAIVGAGAMGGLHARAITRRSEAVGDCRLVAVADRHLARSRRLADAFDTEAAAGPDAVIGAADAVIVAAPTTAHRAVAERLLAGGLDVLVEKPMTGSAEGATALAEQARAAGRVLGVGHSEWFHPTWRRALAAAGSPRQIEIERRMPPSKRGLDIDVVQDFMLHDLDWLRRALPGALELCEGTGRSVEAGGPWDEASVTLGLPGSQGRARLHASRVSASRARRLTIEGEQGRVEADLLTGEIQGGAPGSGPGATLPEAEPSDLDEPLDRQLSDFVAACRERRPPENDGVVAIETLRLVDRVREMLREAGGD